MINELLDEIHSGILDNEKLRRSIETYGRSCVTDYIYRSTGIKTGIFVNCSDCMLPSFSKTLNSCYGGMTYTCPACTKMYTYCEQCASMILQDDNDMHFHIGELGNRRKELTLATYREDIMRSGGAKLISHKDTPPLLSRQRYLGIELEVEKARDKLIPPDLILKVLDCLGKNAMVKRDGSLSRARNNPQNGSNGFEIVSLPCTLQYHLNSMGWQRLFEVINKWIDPKPQRAGLHVHVSSDSVSKIAVGRIIKFINHPDNLEFLKIIANRDFTLPNPDNGRIYSRVFPDTKQKVKELINKKKHAPDCRAAPGARVLATYYLREDSSVAYDVPGRPIIKGISPVNNQKITCRCPDGNYGYKGHYAAFNLRTNRPTIEFRIFQASSNLEHFFASLEFCDAICEFAEANSMDNMDHRAFVEWFKGNRHHWKFLARWLVVNGFIDPLKKKEQ